MGASRWDEASYNSYSSTVANRAVDNRLLRHGTSYTADINEGRVVRRVHQMLDPHGVTMRESRDSAANPNSLPVAVFFDVTGSMGSIPVTLQTRLKTLMTTLINRGYAADPAVFFGGIGDASCDGGPLQVGQFESDIQMDEDLSRMWLEGGGGGQNTESYELAYYFAARHMVTDSWEKRQKKGYLFTIGDEMPYTHVNPHQIHNLIGEDVRRVSTEAIIAECEQRWHCFHILMETGTSRRYPITETTWRALLGDKVLKMDDPNHVAELIALVVGITEQRVSITDGAAALREMGVAEGAITAITAAVTPFARGIVLTA